MNWKFIPYSLHEAHEVHRYNSQLDMSVYNFRDKCPQQVHRYRYLSWLLQGAIHLMYITVGKRNYFTGYGILLHELPVVAVLFICWNCKIWMSWSMELLSWSNSAYTQWHGQDNLSLKRLSIDPLKESHQSIPPPPMNEDKVDHATVINGCPVECVYLLQEILPHTPPPQMRHNQQWYPSKAGLQWYITIYRHAKSEQIVALYTPTCTSLSLGCHAKDVRKSHQTTFD